MLGDIIFLQELWYVVKNLQDYELVCLHFASKKRNGCINVYLLQRLTNA